jgi:excinuclease UvrABC nuclease subunit
MIRFLEERTWYALTEPHVDMVPEVPGVYWLGENDQNKQVVTIYIGKAVFNLRQRIKDHLTTTDRCIMRSTHFAYERHSNPDAREKELLQDFLRRNGRLPRCNDQVG